MKLKEFPHSLYLSTKLWATPVSRLQNSPAEVAPGTLISLTSIESRLPTLHLVVRSLLLQDLVASRIVLWLHTGLKSRIPKNLTRLQSDRFTVAWSEETCSHRKLVEPLRHHPEYDVVTCDDDVIYHKTWLRRLIEQHRKTPSDVVAHECREIGYDESGAPLPYAEWGGAAPGASSPRTMSIGYGGVLYPKGLMPAITTDADLYMKLAPRADDLWFKAVGLAHGLHVRRTSNPPPKPVPIPLTQRISLKSHNVREDGNRQQWIALERHFDLRVGAE